MRIRKLLALSAILLAFTLSGATVGNEPRSDFFTASDGVKIHYLTLGDHGSWVVLIHGYTDSARRMFFSTGIAQALAPNHRVVAIDNRNHGESDKPTPGGAGRAEDTIELMDHLHIAKAHIHGYSMGGGITGQLLATHPDRFITAAFGGSGIPEADPELRKQAAALDKPMPAPQGAEAEAFKHLRETVAAAAAARGDKPGAAVPRQPLQIDLTTITVPVFAVNGEFDSPHAKTQRMWRELGDFTNVVLPGKNHMSAIAVGQPMDQQYVENLVAFINSHDQK